MKKFIIIAFVLIFAGALAIAGMPFSAYGMKDIPFLRGLADSHAQYEEALNQLRESRKALREANKTQNIEGGQEESTEADQATGKWRERIENREAVQNKIAEQKQERDKQRLEHSKDIVSHSIGMIQAKIGRIENHIARRSDKAGEAERERALEGIADIKSFLNEISAVLEEAETIEEVKSIAQEIRERWRLARLSIHRAMILHFGLRLEELAGIIESRIDRLEELSAEYKDTDTGKEITGELEGAQTEVKKALELIAEAREQVSAQSESESWQDHQEAVRIFREAHQHLRSALNHIREAARLLRGIVPSPEPTIVPSVSPAPTAVPTVSPSPAATLSPSPQATSNSLF